ncbi:MAG: imidazole glycerol phosphate synthase subunit HisH [Bacteroidetes bacterium]|nr:imidazole glycerol phosphate synthase subunit HisH [Bacteroidota bacterium]MBS1683642.1 imidazole glycerol phosphate synthase subunit HisH [Bacteroidota bacterium]
MKVVIIDYGAGNTRSVSMALERLGAEAILSSDVAEISSADKVIFPGVGHARPAMQALRQRGLDIAIPQLKQPLLGICLGMQLLCAHTDEGDTPCLGVFDQRVRLFPPDLKVPHMGWNTTIALRAGDVFPSGWYYFVHSYYVPANADTALTCHYIHDFSAAMRRNNFYAVQFHPEKSGTAGELLLSQFLKL